MLPLLILICNFLIRKWSSNSSSNASQQSESTGIVDSSDSTLPSDASLALSTGEYEVFLSFRGPDTRREITDVLYHFLVRSKIRTFKDDEDLRVGEGIWPSLVEAIKDSKIYVPIFSETYAHSKWCLKELAEMIECQKQHKRHIILPIFYKVDPGDVRKQTGPYEEAFKQHRKNFDDKTIQNWKDALKEVGQLKGWHVTNNDGQGAIADAVFEVIWSHLSKNYELMTDELVGIDGHVKAVVERLDLDSKGVIMVGIHGIGGIGKTTIATAVFNKICAHFDRYCFVDGVRETLQQRDGMIALQNKIISSAAKKVSPVSNASEGIRMIRDRVSQYKVLIVLDDVDDKFKFDNILGKFEHFVSSSRFIITSRNTKVLTSLRCCKLYEVGEMSFEHSLQLFCKHAFRKDYPPHDYRTLSRDILSTTGGLPLTIKVVGSLLFQEEKDVWEEKLVRLQEMPEMEVFERLKISYDALEYEAKQIFLDIACFYVGTDKEIASYMWSDCKFYPVSSISVLIQRSIIKIGDKNEFKMHDQLRDMGKAIVREEDIEHPWMRSRIWSDDDAFELLVGKKGTDRVKAVRANSSSPEICQLTNEHFRNLSDLRYLDGNSTELTGDFNDLLDNLRWLQLHYHEDSGDRLKNFHMNKLVILDLRGSDITDDWGGWIHIKMARKLKVLDLSYCRFITKVPDLSTHGSLEHLHLYAVRGTTQDLNIGNVKNIKVLNLENCRIRKIVGGNIGTLQQLRELNVSSCKCENLGLFLADISTLPSLKILKLLPPSLTELHLSVCPKLECLPNFENLENLIELSIYRCSMLRKIEGCGGRLKSLTTLKIDYAESLIHINILESHIFGGIDGDDQIHEFLQELEVGGCTLLEKLPNLSKFPSLRKLGIWDMKGIMKLDGLESLEGLRVLELSDLPFIESLPRLSKLRKLELLVVSDMHRLREVQGIEDLESLEQLLLPGCTSLEKLPDLSGLKSLQVVNLRECSNLNDLSGLNNLQGVAIERSD
ncbi:Disease resistance protein L6 [Linum perenne]